MIALAFLVGCGGSSEPAALAPLGATPDFAPVPMTRTAAFPAPIALDAGALRARETLHTLLVQRATDPMNPWAVKHAWIALGADVKVSDGSDSVDAMFQRWAKPVRLADRDLVEFPAKGEGDDVRIEPHTDLLLKGLAESGVSPNRVVSIAGVAHPIGDLWRSSLARTWVDGDQLWTTSWNDTPWTLYGLAAWAPPNLTWTAEGAHPMTMNGFTHAVVVKLGAETKFLRDAEATGAPVEKRKQGIFAYTCGGAHLLQGAAFAVARGFGEPEDRVAIQGEVGALYYRYDVEMKSVDDALAAYPQYEVVLLVQRAKWLGHFLETASELAAYGFYAPDDAQKAVLQRAVADLADTVERTERAGIYDHLDTLQAKERQTYLDVLGDGAHALHGLDLVSGAATVRY